MAPNLIVTLQKINDLPNATLVTFQGDFDSNAHLELGAIEKEIQEAPADHHFIFDLIGLRFLNSYAIGQLVGWHNVTAPKNGKILIAGANKNVEEIFSILGIMSLFEIYPDVLSAANSLK